MLSVLPRRVLKHLGFAVDDPNPKDAASTTNTVDPSKSQTGSKLPSHTHKPSGPVAQIPNQSDHPNAAPVPMVLDSNNQEASLSSPDKDLKDAWSDSDQGTSKDGVRVFKEI